MTIDAPACPGCGGSLAVEESSSHYGSRLQVERCTRCRGVFTTWGKLQAWAPEAVTGGPSGSRAIAERGTGEIDPAPTEVSPCCPTCGRTMHRAASGDLPPPLKIPDGVVLHLCTEGHGFWLSDEHLRRFKEAQRQRLHRKRTEDLEERARRKEQRDTLTLFPEQDDRARSGHLALWSSMVVGLAFLALAVAGSVLIQIATS